MKLHRIAALALMGWYLMTPPWDQYHQHDSSVPISRWIINGRYGTLAKCSDAQMQNLTYWNQVDDEQMLDAFWQSACIAIDGSRLQSE